MELLSSRVSSQGSEAKKMKRCVRCGADVWSSHYDRWVCYSKLCLRLVAEVSE